MKIISYCLLILTISVFPCYGRLGETVGECHQRYGEPNMTAESGRATFDVFIVGTFTIGIYYLDHKSVAVVYTKLHGKISMDETITILIEKEADGKKWGKPFVSSEDVTNADTGIVESHTETGWARTDGVSATLDDSPSAAILTLLSSDREAAFLVQKTIRDYIASRTTKGL